MALSARLPPVAAPAPLPSKARLQVVYGALDRFSKHARISLAMRRKKIA
jgi:hypothetical protein